MDEVYLGTKRLCAKIDLAPQTIYNWVCQGKLVAGVHYFKPPGSNKLFFRLSAILAWLQGSCDTGSSGDGASLQESSGDGSFGLTPTAEVSADDRKVERKIKRASAISKGLINI